jgi:hypothetical protein
MGGVAVAGLTAILLWIPSASAMEQIAFVGTVWTVVDTETAEAIRMSARLARFASFEVRTTHANGGRTWTGREEAIGRSTLRIGRGATASWNFDLPSARGGHPSPTNSGLSSPR